MILFNLGAANFSFKRRYSKGLTIPGPMASTFGKMTLEIKDKEGNTVTSLSPSKSKGINIVDWGFTKKQPKVAKGKTLSRGGFTSPRVREGIYTVEIKKGKDVFESKNSEYRALRFDATPPTIIFCNKYKEILLFRAPWAILYASLDSR